MLIKHVQVLMQQKNINIYKMNKYQDKEAAMDDYSHERKLRIDGRYEMEHGCKECGEDDFDHAHALKEDAHHDHMSRFRRHPILKHSHRMHKR